MGKIIVNTKDGRITEVDGSSWHIDDLGYLHVRKENNGGNAATFHVDQWTSVEHESSATSTRSASRVVGSGARDDVRGGR